MDFLIEVTVTYGKETASTGKMMIMMTESSAGFESRASLSQIHRHHLLHLYLYAPRDIIDFVTFPSRSSSICMEEEQHLKRNIEYGRSSIASAESWLILYAIHGEEENTHRRSCLSLCPYVLMAVAIITGRMKGTLRRKHIMPRK